VPNQPKTPLHSFRISDEEWKAGQEAAARRGENFSEELRKMVRRYAKKPDKRALREHLNLPREE
jgi:hypothetical protein